MKCGSRCETLKMFNEKVQWADVKTMLLYLSVFITIMFMMLCILSAIFSFVELKHKLDNKVTEYKAVQVPKYDPPAILLLANGLYTYECITSSFRVDPKAVDSDFPDFDPEDKRSRISASCGDQYFQFAITLDDLIHNADILEELPTWLKKNLMTTLDVSACEEEEESKKRVRRYLKPLSEPEPSGIVVSGRENHRNKANELAANEISERDGDLSIQNDHPRVKREVYRTGFSHASMEVHHSGLENFKKAGWDRYQGDRRMKRDAVDDPDRCDGSCSFIWECSNNPTLCKDAGYFSQCWDSWHPLSQNEPCATFHQCIGGPVVLPSFCSDYVWCMRPENYREPSRCFEVVECFRNASRVGKCYDIFQCMEDQIQPKCDYITTKAPLQITGDQVAASCGAYADIMAEEPSLANLNNKPLALLIFKGPEDYSEKDFLFFSSRMEGKDQGAWVAVHTDYNEVMEWANSTSNLRFLLKIITQLKWQLNLRLKRSFNLITSQIIRDEGIKQSSSIRAETTISKINESDPGTFDYRPVEMLFQWKDGYIVEGDRFISVTVWDAFAVVASILLMLDRAYTTWGRVVNKVVKTKSEMHKQRYSPDSAEYKLLKTIEERCTNLFTSLVALSKMRRVEIRLKRLDHKRKLEEERIKVQVEAIVNKIRKKLAVRNGRVSQDLLNYNEKRILEWKAYRKMLRVAIADEELNRKEMSKRDAERLRRLEEALMGMETPDFIEPKKQEKRQSIQSTISNDESDASSDIEWSDNEGEKEKAVVMKHAEFQQELRKKRKKFINIQFNMPGAQIDDAQMIGAHIGMKGDQLDTGPWLMNQPAKKSATNAPKPAQWMSTAFES